MRGSTSDQPADAQAMQRLHLASGLTPRNFELVGEVPLFAGLDRGRRIDLLSDAWVRRVPRNTILFLQDEPARCFFVILEGWVRLYRETPGGHESIIEVLAPGESFAEAAIFLNGVYPLNAAVVEDARLLCIPSEPFLRRLRESPRVGIQPETLSRSLARLRRIGVETEGSRVLIRDLAGLRQFSAGDEA